MNSNEKVINYRLCSFCNINVPTRQWAKHSYSASHKRNFKKSNSNVLIIPNEETINLQNIKFELLEIQSNINLLINKIDKIKNV
jgi:hypothetical protein